MMRAALEENVKRVIITSSGLTIYNYAPTNKSLSEDDWVPLSEARTAYQKSKIIAEKAAWEFYEQHKNDPRCFKLATVIPVWVIGPPLSAANGSSVTRFSNFLNKNVEKVNNMYTGICDVRDVAQAHLRAAQTDEAVGKRILVVSENRLVSMIDIATILQEAGYKVNKVEDTLDKSQYVGTTFENKRMRTILKMEPTELKKTVLDMAESLINFGLVQL